MKISRLIMQNSPLDFDSS